MLRTSNCCEKLFLTRRYRKHCTFTVTLTVESLEMLDYVPIVLSLIVIDDPAIDDTTIIDGRTTDTKLLI